MPGAYEQGWGSRAIGAQPRRTAMSNELRPTEVASSAGRAPTVVAAPPEVIEAEFVDLPTRRLRDHVRVLAAHRRLAWTVGVSVLALVVVVTVLMPRWYTATMRIQVVHESPVQLRLQSNVLQVDESDRTVNGTSSFLQTQITALQSRDLAERVIRNFGLLQHPAFEGDGRGMLSLGSRVLSVLRPRGWSDASEAEEGTSAEGGDPIDPDVLKTYVEDWLDVRDVRGTDVLEVSFSTPDPRLSAFLAATHVQAYLDASDEARASTGGTARVFLGRQRQEADARARTSEAALEEFATKHPNIAVNQEQQLLGQRITEISNLYTAAHGERIDLQTRFEFLSDGKRDPLPYFLNEPSVQKIETGLSGVRLQKAAVGGRLGPNHPEMLELGHQETDLLQQRRAEITRLVTAVRMQFDAASAREEGLRRSLEQAELQQVNLRELGTQYDLLRTEAQNARDLQQSLLKQQAETAVSSELAATNVRVLERAEVPDRPSWPKLPLNFAIGLVLSAASAVGAAFARDHFDETVKSSDEVAGLLQLPTLAVVPNFGLGTRAAGGARVKELLPAEPGALVIAEEPQSAAAEAFRMLRTTIGRAGDGDRARVLVVTSGRAGEGKTTISTNLAAAIAESGLRVLLVDADLRRPGCHVAFGVENRFGLSTLLAGDADLGSVVRPVAGGKLSLIAAGPSPENPAELLSSTRMREVMEALRDRYDCVLIDTPPALPVTDAVVVAREADGVILVLRGGNTPREIVQRAREQLVRGGATVLGTVVNNVGPGWREVRYGYRGDEGYYARRGEEAAGG